MEENKKILSPRYVDSERDKEFKIEYSGDKQVKQIKYFRNGKWEVYKDESTAGHQNKKLLVRKYFKKKVDTAINLANLSKEDEILDFGCGAGTLKNRLRTEGYKVTGYDITPEHSDIEDYTKLSPNKIFAMDVFEHMFKEDIILTLQNFKKMSNHFFIVVSIPVEGLIYRNIRRLMGKRPIDVGHITNIKELKSILNHEFKFVKGKNILNLTYVGLWEYKKSF